VCCLAFEPVLRRTCAIDAREPRLGALRHAGRRHVECCEAHVRATERSQRDPETHLPHETSALWRSDRRDERDSRAAMRRVPSLHATRRRGGWECTRRPCGSPSCRTCPAPTTPATAPHRGCTTGVGAREYTRRRRRSSLIPVRVHSHRSQSFRERRLARRRAAWMSGGAPLRWQTWVRAKRLHGRKRSCGVRERPSVRSRSWRSAASRVRPTCWDARRRLGRAHARYPPTLPSTVRAACSEARTRVRSDAINEVAAA
jgi:hypothetical protein